ncbi:hypothetical protein K2173_028575 [Erythroxylum novogranatense]|uniref:Pentatricopeptide repeat-containing protein n=1 Tax=Erythroxylum novogranatense TaxID=1862640 RepID=A0AAV8U2J8_9ROSI|nr:hypothetical protein K2173_028575 [Erythroxylum novogranatense]
MIMDLKCIVAALRHCGRFHAIKQGKAFHSHLIKTGFSHNVYAANNLVSMYMDSTFLDQGRKLFDEMPDRNIVTWTTMVSAYTNSGQPQEAIKLYTQMLDCKAEVPNGFMYSVVLKACSLVGNIELGRLIHGRIAGEKFDNDIVLMNTLLDMYVKCRSLNDAREVFDEIISTANSTSWNIIISGHCKERLMKEAVDLFHLMPEPNSASWNNIIGGFADNGNLRALEFVYKMHHKGFKLDEFTFPCALKTCSYVGFLDMGKQIHSYVLKLGFESSCFTLSALVDMYSNCNALNAALKLFHQNSDSSTSFCDNLALWNSMLSGYVVNGKNITAIAMLLRIYRSGSCMDSYTLSSALKVCINLLNLRLGIQVHGLVVCSGYELDCVVGSILIDLYAKVRNIRDAFLLFNRIPKKDIVAWSGLLMGCSKVELNSLSFSLFRDMINLDLEVDQYVVSSVLKVCSSLACLQRGKQVHAFCIKSGYEAERVTLTALIDMYSKSGEIDAGLALFDTVHEKDVVCWTGIIVGCGQNGRATEAVKLFEEMVQKGLKPNEVTFLGVLSACRHAGLIEEGWSTFKSMKLHGLQPHLEHYYCVVDLLGQAGHFNEVEDLIVQMPFKPDRTIWSSLLGACVTHRNSKLVGEVADHLLATSPNDPSVYVMLSNAYATLEMWDSLRTVREASKTLGIKEAGVSWVDISF